MTFRRGKCVDPVTFYYFLALGRSFSNNGKIKYSRIAQRIIMTWWRGANRSKKNKKIAQFQIINSNRIINRDGGSNRFFSILITLIMIDKRYLSIWIMYCEDLCRFKTSYTEQLKRRQNLWRDYPTFEIRNERVFYRIIKIVLIGRRLNFSTT